MELLMMKLYLLRHSRTRANLDFLYCGKTDIPLAPEGVEIARNLTRTGGYPDLTGVKLYTSGMRRAEETFTLLFGERPHGQLPGFREIDFGEFEMKSYYDLKDTPAYQAWLDGDSETTPCPGGESGSQMSSRVLHAAQELLSRGEDALVLCHGGPIASLMAHWFPEEPRNRYEWQPSACEGYAVTFEEGTPTAWSPLPSTT